MRFRSMVVLAAAGAGLCGCATLVNPGQSHSVAAPSGAGSHVKVARLRLRNTGPVLSVYDGNRQLPILDEASEQLHVAVCRTYHEDQRTPPGLVTVNADCMTWILFPYVELDKSVSHTLRLVRGAGDEATVTVKTGMHWQWIWLNAVCTVAMPICWGVDFASGSMAYFGSLDVAHAMQSASRSASVSHE